MQDIRSRARASGKLLTIFIVVEKMALLPVYRRSAQILHSSPICSFAFLFRATICLLTYIPPFFVAYFTGGFWEYESTYREQPRVHFTRDVMVSLGGCPTADAALGSSDRSWSTFRRHVDLLQPESTVFPLMVSTEEDYTYDGLKDVLHLTLTFPVQQNSPVCAVNALLFFDIALTRFVQVHLQSALHVSSSWSVPSHRLWVGGLLAIHQTLPLPSFGTITTYNVSLVDRNSQLSRDYEMTTILDKQLQRNITTHLSDANLVWESGATSEFLLQFTIRYPPQSIVFRPGFWQLAKFGWIQYLGVWFLFYLVSRVLLLFVFNHWLLRTVVSSHDLKVKYN